MNTLEKPTTPQPETGKMPAEEAGIFLCRTYALGPGAEISVMEIVAKVQALERAGRLIGQMAAPGTLTIYAVPDAEGAF